MTNRLQYPTYWASGGAATDPDLDTTAPSYEPDKYEKHGWHAEKPPEKWQNFLSQITDQKIIAKMVDGLPYYDASVTYQEGAIYRKDDKFYKVEGGVGKEVIEVNATLYNNLVNSLNTLWTTHRDADNPHQDTVDTLVGGGYTKTAVDDFFGSLTDPQTIVFHKAQMGAGVHGETAAATGALPAATGGEFTGDVIFVENAIASVTPSKYTHYNKATGLLELVNGTVALGIDAVGNAYITKTTGSSLVLTDYNMINFIVQKYQNAFTLPPPMIAFYYENSLSSALNAGSAWTTITTKAPTFIDGALKVDDNETSVFFNDIYTAITIYMLVRLRDGTKKGAFANYDSWTQAPNTISLKAMASQLLPADDIECVFEYIVYPQLSPYQTSTLAIK